MPVIDADGCPLWVEVEGPRQAPALILSSSLGTSLHMWDAQVATFAQDFRVVRYDRRGHGRSGVPAGPYTMERLGRDALAVADELGLETFDWCGLSMGGMEASPTASWRFGSARNSAPALRRWSRPCGPCWRPRRLQATSRVARRFATWTTAICSPASARPRSSSRAGRIRRRRLRRRNSSTAGSREPSSRSSRPRIFPMSSNRGRLRTRSCDSSRVRREAGGITVRTGSNP